ncbi:hypothetical protein IPM62_01145 [Candidatus Woesebacteria bacterium]|nr:MAG: hypothetical protein IPM62_01145 [Candidatus Woesebacteria bacterium]
MSPDSSKNPANFKPGDILVLKPLDSSEVLDRIVDFIHVYSSVEEMAKNEPVEKIFSGCKSPEELAEIFEEVKKKWGKVYTYKIEKYGIVAIGINKWDKRVIQKRAEMFAMEKFRSNFYKLAK